MIPALHRNSTFRAAVAGGWRVGTSEGDIQPPAAAVPRRLSLGSARMSSSVVTGRAQHSLTVPPASRQAAMPPIMWQTLPTPLWRELSTAIAERSPKAQ